MDIKGLKHDVWDLLCEAGGEAGVEAGGEAAKGKEEAGVEGEVSFQSVLGKLHEKVPEQALPDVSFAYCFICLLHLANEKGLSIEGSEDMTDLTISQLK